MQILNERRKYGEKLSLSFWGLNIALLAILFTATHKAIVYSSNCSLRQVLLQSEEELMAKQTSELAGEKAAPKPKKMVGKMKVQGKLNTGLMF